MLIRNRKETGSHIEHYLDCVKSTPEYECDHGNRDPALAYLMSAVEITAWNILVLVPTIFYFGYKEVRNMWISILTCGSRQRKRDPSRKDMSLVHVNLQNIERPH
jgi:hypothetical protein